MVFRRFGFLPMACLVTAVSLVAGCGEMAKKPLDVTGTISIDGQPLNQGAVIITNDIGERSFGEIRGDGTFLVPQVVPGSIRVAVSVPKRRGPIPKESDPNRGTRPLPVPIPSRYEDIATSGLEFEIIEGPNELNIELQRKPSR